MPGFTPRGYEYPLYGETQNFPSDIQSLATSMDTDLNALFVAANHARNAPTASVQLTVPQTIPTGVTTNINFDTEIYDNASMVNLGVQPQQIAITEVGVYLMQFTARFNAGNANAVAILPQSLTSPILDVVSVTKEAVAVAAPSTATTISATAVTRCTLLTERIILRVLHNTGAPLDVLSAYMTVTKIAL